MPFLDGDPDYRKVEGHLLPAIIIEGLRLYYKHRSLQLKAHWNKSQDIDTIFEHARKHGWGSVAIAGTFWFDRRLTDDEILTIEVSEDSVARGGHAYITKRKKEKKL